MITSRNLPITFYGLYIFFNSIMSSTESETVYDRIAKLEDEVAALRSEIDFLKRALRNELARHEVKMARKGNEVDFVID